MVKTLAQAIAEVANLPAADQEQIGRQLLSHLEKLRALRAEIDKGVRSLDAAQGRELSFPSPRLRGEGGERSEPGEGAIP